MAGATAALLGTFLLNVSVPEEALEAALGGPRLLGELADLGLLWRPLEAAGIPAGATGRRWRAAVQIVPMSTGGHNGALLAAVDWDEMRPWHQVMTATIDTYALLRAQRLTRPGWAPRRVLDLCSGSGAQGLHAAALFSQFRRTSVHLVDLNPRAMRFAKANVLLNGLPRVALHLGSLYSALPRQCAASTCEFTGGRFDLILANPPYVPSMGGGQLFVAGGATGETVTEAIVRGAPSALGAGGRLMLVANLANVHQGYAEKLLRWWREGAGGRGAPLALRVLHGDVWTPDDYAAGFLGSAEDRGRYRQFLRRAGVGSMSNGFIFASRARARCAASVKGVPELWHALVDGSHARHRAASREVAEALDDRGRRHCPPTPACPCSRCRCRP